MTCCWCTHGNYYLSSTMLWYPASRCLGPRCLQTRKLAVTAVLLALSVVVVVFLHAPPQRSTLPSGTLYEFQPASERPREVPEPTLRFFKAVSGRETVLYSAIANDREPSDGDTNIIITAFDVSGTDSVDLTCCLLAKEGGKLYTTLASVFVNPHVYDGALSSLSSLWEVFQKAPTKVAKQYACVLPELALGEASHVALTSSLCPVTLDEYLPVLRPKVVSGGLAVCVKPSPGETLDPQRLMEWLEMQRLMGVDHVQLMAVSGPEHVQRVVRYYRDTGLLSVVSYRQPGQDRPHRLLSHDQSLALMDCRQRLRGYAFVMVMGLDDLLIPLKHLNVKDLLREQLMSPDAAVFHFSTRHFFYDGGAEARKSDITVLRYLDHTEPVVDRKRHIYLSNRVVHSIANRIFPKPPYCEHEVSREDAIVHNYRQCPQAWSTCNQTRIRDSSLWKLEKQLKDRVELARRVIGVRPTS